MPLGALRPSLRTLLCGLCACLAMFVLLGATGAAPAKAAPTPMSALLLTSSVTNDPTNVKQTLEYQEAVADGYTVTPVDDTTWDGMSTADFETYQLIIIGDQATACAQSPNAEAVKSDSVWEPAVMASGGNKVLIGTDPSRHYTLGQTSAPQLEQNGLAYAGAVSGATGLYLDLGCSFDNDTAGTDEPILDGLTSGTGTFRVEGYNDPSLPSHLACASDVNIVASTGPTSGLTDADLSDPTNKWGCSVHEAFTSFPSDYTPLALAPTSSGFPSEYCANDIETGEPACGAPYILVSGGGVKVSSDVTLSPSDQDITTSPESPGSGTVTATVTASGSTTPLSGQTVTFSVYSGPDKGQTYTGTTDLNGQTTFTVSNDGLPGTDDISASFTNSSGNTEKSLATMTFNGPAPVSATAQNLSGTENTSLGDPTVATFTDPSGGISASGWTTQVSWGDGTSTTTGTVSATSTPNQYALNADHTYTAPGSYMVTATITDTGDAADTITVTSTATIAQGQLTVNAQSPSSPTEGTSTGSIDVATFSDTDTSYGVSSYTATIDWGDGSSSTPGTITAVSGNPGNFTVAGSHNYAEAGTYTVTVTVTGGDDPTTPVSNTASVTVGEAPITLTAGSISPAAGQAFSGQVATFTDGDSQTPLSDYTATIDWGDGSTSTGTISGSNGSYAVSGSHTYTTPATDPLKVTVSENDSGPSATATDTGTATVGDGQLSVTAQSFSPTEGSSASSTVATFTDTDTGPQTSAYSATVDWGDGTTSAGTITAVSGNPGNFTVTGSHDYVEAGAYTVKVTVTAGDDSSFTKSDQVAITVDEAPITVTAGTITPTAGQAFSGQVATFTDGDTETPLSDYTATIDWGDGSTSTGTISGSNGSYTVSGNHTYATPGTDPLKVTVSENDSGPSASGTDTGTSTVTDGTLTVTGRGTLELPSETFSGTLATVHYSVASALSSGFQATVKWGDGATGTGTITGSGGSYTVTGTHTYSGAGPYAVTITVTDPANGSGSATDTVIVPSTATALSLPGAISAKKLLCGAVRHTKCTGVTILGTFRNSGSAAWNVSISRSGKKSVALGTITRTVSAGSTKLVFKVTNRRQAKRLYKLVKKHRLNRLTVQQQFTNMAGASSQTSLYTLVTK